MNNREINRILTSNLCTAKVFAGVYPADMMPTKPLKKRPSAFVFNTRKHNEPGEHWICIYFDKLTNTPSEYFDSYGLPPKDVFRPFLGESFIRSTVMMQHPLSSACGQYCIFYIHQKCLGKTMQQIAANFAKSTNLMENDMRVNQHVEQHFSVDLDIVDADYIWKQLTSVDSSNIPV